MASTIGCIKTMASLLVVLLTTLRTSAGKEGSRTDDVENAFLYDPGLGMLPLPLERLMLPLQLKLLPGHRSRRDVLTPSTNASVTLSMQDGIMELSSTALSSSTVISPATLLRRISTESVASIPPVTQRSSALDDDDSSVFLRVPGESTVEPTMPNFTFIEDYHRYYRSRVATSEEQASFWVDEKAMYAASHHDTLSESYRSAATIQLSFTFFFYGHEVSQITIATGGFLYMSDFLHQWLTATQYIAPLMANFDTQLGNTSHIRYMDNGTVFVVWWEDVYLQDNHEAGFFSFQVLLHKDGRIIFSYKQIPVVISDISDEFHPIKIGLSDAFVLQKDLSYLRQRTIFEYHRIEINMSQVVNNSAIIITPLPTCLSLKTCEDCVNMSSDVASSFQCHWCPSLGKCSDGFDRSRQGWLDGDCDHLFPDTVDKCAAAGKQNWIGSRQSYGALTSSKGVNVVAAVVITAILVIIGTVAVWFAYAYKNPNSRSGLWLIQHRPNNLIERIRQMKRGSRISSKYEVAMQPEAESFA